MSARPDRLNRLRARARPALGLGGLTLLLGPWASPCLGQEQAPRPRGSEAAPAWLAAASPPAEASGQAQTPAPEPAHSSTSPAPTNGVIELPRGWQPQRSLQPQIPWWQVGLNLSNQLIAPLGGAGGAPLNSATAIDLTTSLGSGLNRAQPRGELDRWSLNLHLTNYSSSGNFGSQAGLVSSQFYPQSLFQSPSGLWLQGLWLQRNGLPHERLAQLKVGDLSLGNSFLHGAAINLYVNSLINGHNGLSLPGVPYGPLNALGAMATLRLGQLAQNSPEAAKPGVFGSSLRFGLFQLDAGRNDSQFRGFNQSISPSDGVLELIEWQWPLARRLSHCDGGKPAPSGPQTSTATTPSTTTTTTTIVKAIVNAAGSDPAGPTGPTSPSQARGAGSRGSTPTAAGVNGQPLRFVAPSGCRSSRLLQNQLPEPMLQVTAYNASWSFAGVNGTSLQGMAPAGQAPAGRQANGIAAYLALPTPLPLPFASRLWLSGSLSGPGAINPYPGYLAGGWIGQGVLANRPEDLLILGLAGSSTSTALQPSQPGQAVLELSYQWQLNSKLSLQPYSQLQSGTPGQGPLWTLGLQWSWSL